MKKPIALEISESFEKRPYRQCTEGLEVDGVPWIPLIGRNSFLRTENPSPWHTHNGCIELVYCKHGTCEYESRGKVYRLTPGRVFVSRPNEAHRMLSNPKGLATFYLLFKIPGVRKLPVLDREVRFVERKLRKLPRLFDGGPRTGSHFVRLFRLLEQSFGDKAERRLRIFSTSLSLLLAIIDASEVPMVDGGSSRILALAEEIRRNPERDYPIEGLATKINFSPSSLLAGFKAATGYTPHAYVVKCRINRAKEMLKAGELRVTDVAEELGFPSPQHFATQFRNATGMSPKEWLRQQSS